MARRLNARDPDFARQFEHLLASKRESGEDVALAVRAIIADVRAKGDAALIAHTKRLDQIALTEETLRVQGSELETAERGCTRELLSALDVAAQRIESYHRRQIPDDLRYTDETGAELGWRWTALDSVGIYVPGGTAAYPSSVLMNAVPARVAGVKRIAMVTPATGGSINPLVLAAARRAGVSEVYRIGGAQAVAALAYGTASVAAVDKIVGPGNAYVAAAKREVFGHVGIDSIAGPSEVLVVADASSNPDWVAADLLAQAEHDRSSQCILITADSSVADKVAAAVAARLLLLPRKAIAEASWRDHGAILVISSLDEAPALIDRIAPEHLELCVSEPEALLARVRHAGAVFLGRYTPEAMGDYIAGPNHVLPTSRAARFSSGLSVLDFLKRTTILSCAPKTLAAIGAEAIALAEAEGLDGHAYSIAARLNVKSDR